MLKSYKRVTGAGRLWLVTQIQFIKKNIPTSSDSDHSDFYDRFKSKIDH